MKKYRAVLISIHLLLLFGALSSFSYGFGQQEVAGDSTKSSRSVLLDSLRDQSDLKSKVEYHATDSIVFDIEHRKLFIHSHGKGQKEGANLKYEEIALSADSITIDWEETTCCCCW